jgi:hypothetical protein
MPYTDPERRRQADRDRYAARKLFWQTFIANKDGYDHICCVKFGVPETDPHNPLQYSHNNPATKSFDLARAIMGGFLLKCPFSPTAQLSPDAGMMLE